jgi:predicted alpha/beta-fold hydrolase
VRKGLPNATRLFLGGISLGAIIAANVCVQGSLDDIIDGCVCISGCFDTEINSTYEHSLRAWQPILNLPLKEAFVSPSGNMDKIISKIGINSHNVVSNIHTISQFDSSFITPLHGFNDPHHYYAVMSAGMNNKLQKLRIPMLAIHALDDPILHVDTMPTKVASEGTLTDKLTLLITKTGGHVGWPTGLFPWLSRWNFQNTLTSEFIEAVLDETYEEQFRKAHEKENADEEETPTC